MSKIYIKLRDVQGKAQSSFFLQPCDPPIMERNWQCSSRGFEAEGHNFGGVGKTSLFIRTGQYLWRSWRGGA